MEALKRTFGQYAALYSSMSPSQRGTLIVVPAMIVVALGLLMFSDRSSSFVPLSYGKTFTTAELANAEQSLRAVGLNDFRRDGQRIMVPPGEVERYNAALLEGGSLPTGWASELEKSLENRSIFSSKDQLSAMKEIALAKELRRVIRAVPAIEDASVVWARPKKRRWPHTGKNVTATVNVRPRPGRELSMPLVESLRAAVANMVPDLKSADVTVFDQSTGVSHTADKQDAFDSHLIRWIKQHTRTYQQRIESALSYIPDVVVTVHVDIENLQRSVEEETKFNPKNSVVTSQTDQTRREEFRQQPQRSEPGAKPNQPRNLQILGGNEKVRTTTETKTANLSTPSYTKSLKEYIPAMPKAVQVSVSVPEEYYQGVGKKHHGLTEGKSPEEKKKFQDAVDALKPAIDKEIRTTVAKAIGSATPEEVHVSSYVRIDPEVTEVETSVTDTLGRAVSQWGSTIGLALFALVALRMLYKSMPQQPTEDLPKQLSLSLRAADEEEADKKETVAETTPRDELQSVVRDDPEMAAAVLSKWLQTTN